MNLERGEPVDLPQITTAGFEFYARRFLRFLLIRSLIACA